MHNLLVQALTVLHWALEGFYKTQQKLFGHDVSKDVVIILIKFKWNNHNFALFLHTNKVCEMKNELTVLFVPYNIFQQKPYSSQRAKFKKEQI